MAALSVPAGFPGTPGPADKDCGWVCGDERRSCDDDHRVSPDEDSDLDPYAFAAYKNQMSNQEAVMLAFEDVVGGIEERSSERMNFRTKPRIKQAIQRAAALSGVDDSVFTMNAAYQSALATIAAHERTALQPVDHDAFFAALDNPPAPTDKLRAAFLRHRDTVAST